MNGGAQLGAVTWPYNRQNVIVKVAVTSCTRMRVWPVHVGLRRSASVFSSHGLILTVYQVCSSSTK